MSFEIKTTPEGTLWKSLNESIVGWIITTFIQEKHYQNLPVNPFQTDHPIWQKSSQLPNPEEILCFLTQINQDTKQKGSIVRSYSAFG